MLFASPLYGGPGALRHAYKDPIDRPSAVPLQGRRCSG